MPKRVPFSGGKVRSAGVGVSLDPLGHFLEIHAQCSGNATCTELNLLKWRNKRTFPCNADNPASDDTLTIYQTNDTPQNT